MSFIAKCFKPDEAGLRDTAPRAKHKSSASNDRTDRQKASGQSSSRSAAAGDSNPGGGKGLKNHARHITTVADPGETKEFRQAYSASYAEFSCPWRHLEVTETPNGMLRDVSGLTFISRGARCMVFHGHWQGAEVAVKFMLTRCSDEGDNLRETNLAAAMAHPNLVPYYAIRCSSMPQQLVDQYLARITSPQDAWEALTRSALTARPKTKYRSSVDSLDGLGPPPDCLELEAYMEEQVPNKKPMRLFSAREKLQAVARAAEPLAKHKGWADGLHWGHLLSVMAPLPGCSVTMVIAQYCDLGTLAAAIHTRRAFQLPDQDGPERKMVVQSIIRVAMDVATGLLHLHQHGVVHGDLKPSNVLLQGSFRSGFRAKLTDLGFASVAKVVRESYGSAPADMHSSRVSSGVKPYTPSLDAYVDASDWDPTPYMSPEFLGGVLCMSADIYSLGVLMWELCHGARPFEGFPSLAISQAVMTGKVGLKWVADVPQPLINLTVRCLAYHPTDRPNLCFILSRLAEIDAYLDRDMVPSTRNAELPATPLPATSDAAEPGATATDQPGAAAMPTDSVNPPVAASHVSHHTSQHRLFDILTELGAQRQPQAAQVSAGRDEGRPVDPPTQSSQDTVDPCASSLPASLYPSSDQNQDVVNWLHPLCTQATPGRAPGQGLSTVPKHPPAPAPVADPTPTPLTVQDWASLKQGMKEQLPPAHEHPTALWVASEQEVSGIQLLPDPFPTRLVKSGHQPCRGLNQARAALHLRQMASCLRPGQPPREPYSVHFQPGVPPVAGQLQQEQQEQQWPRAVTQNMWSMFGGKQVVQPQTGHRPLTDTRELFNPGGHAGPLGHGDTYALSMAHSMRDRSRHPACGVCDQLNLKSDYKLMSDRLIQEHGIRPVVTVDNVTASSSFKAHNASGSSHSSQGG